MMMVSLAHVPTVIPALTWCKQHVERGTFLCIQEVFVFECEHTATQFALIWGGVTHD